MRTLFQRYWRKLVIFLCLAIVCISVVTFYFPPTITTRAATTPNGQNIESRTVRDLSIVEAGGRAGSDRSSVAIRQLYLTYRDAYRRVPMVPISTDVSAFKEILKPAVLYALSADSYNHPELTALSDESFDEMVSMVALVAANGNGMPSQEYDTYVANLELVVPEFLFSGYQEKLGAQPSPEKVRAVYEEAYRTARQGTAGEYKLTAITLDPDNIRAAFRRTTIQESGATLMSRLADTEKDYFRGYHGDMSYIFHLPADFYQLKVSRSKLLFFEITFIVKDSYGDAYPLWMKLFFDPHLKRWCIGSVQRMVSVPATNRPPLVF